MIRSWLRGLAVAAIVAAASQPAIAQSMQPPAWVNDDRFPPVFDMYWRARMLHTYAGSRMCSFAEPRNYDDPRSDFRPINQRMQAAGRRIEVRWPGALNTVRPPYMMPPSQLLCNDERAANEALFAFETSVTALERLLDDVERARQSAREEGH